MKKKLLVLKIILSALLFWLSLQYEQASPERATVLVALFTLYLGWGLLRIRIGSFFWLFYIDALLLLFLDYETRFVVNYFIHFIYFLLIIEAGLVLKRKDLNRTILPIIFIALIKYLYLIYYQLNARTLSELLFHLFALLFILLLFHYVQLQKDERIKNELLYKELLTTHRQLKNYMEKAEETTTLKERNRIAREIHDSVGHELTALIMQLEMSLLAIGQDNTSTSVEEYLVSAKNSAKNCLQETRKAVHELKEENISVFQAISYLVEKIEKDQEINVHLHIDEKVQQLPFSKEENGTLYRVIQESLTNAMRYSSEKEIWLEMNGENDSKLTFSIKNKINRNTKWKEGFGITNMRTRLEQLDGILKAQVLDDVFCINGELPIGKRRSKDDKSCHC